MNLHETLALAGAVCGVVSAGGITALLVHEFRRAPFLTPQGEVCAPSPGVPSTPRPAAPVVVTDHTPVTPEDLMALRVLCARLHPYDQDAAEAVYLRILDGIAADEAVALTDELQAFLSGGAA